MSPRYISEAFLEEQQRLAEAARHALGEARRPEGESQRVAEIGRGRAMVLRRCSYPGVVRQKSKGGEVPVGTTRENDDYISKDFLNQ